MTPACSVCGFAVEWVRTCFASRWLLFLGSSQQTRGRYVRTPAPVVHYPGWHNLGSRDWTSDERDPWPALGEYEGPREYYTGAAPPVFPAPLLLGTADCLENGERFPLPVGRVYVNGFDQRCFPPPPTPPPPRPVSITSRADQITLAEVQDLLYTDPSSAGDLLAERLGPGTVVTIVPNSASTIPGTIIATSPRETIVVISGTSNYQQLALELLYGGIGISDFGYYSTIPLWHDAGSVIAQRMEAAAVDMTRPVTFVGHSYGGAVAYLLALRIKYGNANAPVQLLTYGMPRPGDIRSTELARAVPAVNIAMAQDPIPGLPPTGAELLPFYLVAPAPLVSRWASVDRPGNTWALSIDGTLTPSSNPNFFYALLWECVWAAILGTPLGAFDNHDIKAYLFALRLQP